jgi:hypothetical protein
MPESTFKMDLDDPKYLLALGTFIAEFAAVEVVLNSAVWHFAELRSKPQIASAIFEGALRADRARQILTRLVEAKKLKGSDFIELKIILDHLGEIGRARNDIVHLGAAGSSGRLTVTNKPYAHTRTRVRTRTVGPRILQTMIDDLSEIFVRLTIIADDMPPPHTRREMRRDFPPLTTPTAWRYKPRVQSPRPRKTGGTRKKSSTPPTGPLT